MSFIRLVEARIEFPPNFHGWFRFGKQILPFGHISLCPQLFGSIRHPAWHATWTASTGYLLCCFFNSILKWFISLRYGWKQQLTLALSPVHQRQSIWRWIATLSQPFTSMEIQSTMYQILDTLVPWWHLAQVTSKGESHLLGVHSGSWNNFGIVHTYPLQQKSSCLILLVLLYYSMVVNRGWSPRIWKTKSTPSLPHATE